MSLGFERDGFEGAETLFYGKHSPVGMPCESGPGSDASGLGGVISLMDLCNAKNPLITPMDTEILDRFFKAVITQKNIKFFNWMKGSIDRFKFLDEYLDIPPLAAVIAYFDNDAAAVYKALTRCIESKCVIPKMYTLTYLLALGAFEKEIDLDNLLMLDWLDSIGYKLHIINAIIPAAHAGNLQLLQYIHNKGVKDIEKNIWVKKAALIHGHLHILQWMHSIGDGFTGDNRFDRFDRFYGYTVAIRGYLHILQWMHSIGVEMNTRTLIKAYRYPEIVQWLGSIELEQLQLVDFQEE